MSIVVWLRRCFRLHDNPILDKAIRIVKSNAGVKNIVVVSIWEENHVGNRGSEHVARRQSVHRARFTLETFEDHDAALQKLGSKLYVVKGHPRTVFQALVEDKNMKVKMVLYDELIEPYYRDHTRDVKAYLKRAKVKCHGMSVFTLYDPADLAVLPTTEVGGDIAEARRRLRQQMRRAVNERRAAERSASNGNSSDMNVEEGEGGGGQTGEVGEAGGVQHGSAGGSDGEDSGGESSGGLPDDIIRTDRIVPPTTFSSFMGMLHRFGPPGNPLKPITEQLPPPPEKADENEVLASSHIPTLEEWGYDSEDILSPHSPFHGGESEGLRRLVSYLESSSRVDNFDKPSSDPTLFDPHPATTGVSAYLSMGALSCKTFHSNIVTADSNYLNNLHHGGSLISQIYWREFFFCAATITRNFDQMKGNPICVQIAWDENDKYRKALVEAKTGYPWIDAAMTQLKGQGWTHHLARHAVACFMSRGDLYLHWEEGVKIFEEYQIDYDWALCNGNWLWLSASAFYSAYFRVYSPVVFAQHNDPEGLYIKHFIPQLSHLPAEFVYEPWKAPPEVLRSAKLSLPDDYPLPVVDHDEASKHNVMRMRMAYAVMERKEVRDRQRTDWEVHIVKAVESQERANIATSYEEALSEYEAAVEHYEKAINTEPEENHMYLESDTVFNYGDCLLAVAKLKLDGGEENIEDVLMQAYDTYTRAYQKWPDDRISLYHFASVCALLKKREEAASLLRRCISLGVMELDDLQWNPDFDLFRSERWFHDLYEGMFRRMTKGGDSEGQGGEGGGMAQPVTSDAPLSSGGAMSGQTDAAVWSNTMAAMAGGEGQIGASAPMMAYGGQMFGPTSNVSMDPLPRELISTSLYNPSQGSEELTALLSSMQHMGRGGQLGGEGQPAPTQVGPGGSGVASLHSSPLEAGRSGGASPSPYVPPLRYAGGTESRHAANPVVGMHGALPFHTSGRGEERDEEDRNARRRRH